MTQVQSMKRLGISFPQGFPKFGQNCRQEVCSKFLQGLAMGNIKLLSLMDRLAQN